MEHLYQYYESLYSYVRTMQYLHFVLLSFQGKASVIPRINVESGEKVHIVHTTEHIHPKNMKYLVRNRIAENILYIPRLYIMRLEDNLTFKFNSIQQENEPGNFEELIDLFEKKIYKSNVHEMVKKLNT